LIFVLAVMLLLASAGESAAQAVGVLVTDPAGKGAGSAVGTVAVGVRWTAADEHVSVMWHVDGPVTRAVWLVPVPPGAKVTAATGDPEIFARLAQRIRPEKVSYLRDPRLLWREGDGDLEDAAGGLLDGADRAQALSSTFKSLDSATRWAGEQGVSISSNLKAAFQPYLAKGWDVLAVSLIPNGDQARVSGNIGPLDIAFRTSELVLPLAGGADLPGSYPARILAAVLADHQVAARGWTGAGHRGVRRVGPGAGLRWPVGPAAFPDRVRQRRAWPDTSSLPGPSVGHRAEGRRLSRTCRNLVGRQLGRPHPRGRAGPGRWPGVSGRRAAPAPTVAVS
jgi:hypothetical protein